MSARPTPFFYTTVPIGKASNPNSCLTDLEYLRHTGVLSLHKIRPVPSTQCCCHSVTQSSVTLSDTTDCSTPGFPVSWSLLKLTSIEVVTPSKHLILCLPLFLLPSIFPSIRVFSSELAPATGGQSIGAVASASVLSMNIQDWFPLGLTGLIFLQSKGLSKSLLQHYSLRGAQYIFFHMKNKTIDGGAFPTSVLPGRVFLLHPCQLIIPSGLPSRPAQITSVTFFLCFRILPTPLDSTCYIVPWVTTMDEWPPTTLWKLPEGRNHVSGTSAQVSVHRRHTLGVESSITVTIHENIFRAASLFDQFWFSLKSLSWKMIPLGQADLMVHCCISAMPVFLSYEWSFRVFIWLAQWKQLFKDLTVLLKLTNSYQSV